MAELAATMEAHEPAADRRLKFPAISGGAVLPKDYPLVGIAAFLVFLAALVALRQMLSRDAMRDIPWLLVIAAIPLLPVLLPLLSKYLSGLRAGPVELTFRQLQTAGVTPDSTSIEDVALRFAGASIAEMSTRSRDIVARVREIEADKTEVVPINIGGERWRLAALYFFAFLLESRTSVRRLILEQDGAFVGKCVPRALRRAIEREHPLYHDVREKTPMIDLDQAGERFFRSLAETGKCGDEAEFSPTATPADLAHMLGASLERSSIDQRELDDVRGLRRLLSSDSRYVAVVDRGRLACVVDQHRISLEIARRATGG
jgi:hypothetical protein